MPECNEQGSATGFVCVLDNRLAIGELNGTGGVIKSYVLNSQTGQWEFETEIRPPELGEYDGYARSITLHHDAATDAWFLAAGCPGRDVSMNGAGSTHVFRLAGPGEWEHVQELVPSVPVTDGRSGESLVWATVGERTFLAVGAPSGSNDHMLGSVDVFEQNGQGLFTFFQHLQAPDGTPDDAFGFSLSAAEGNGESILVIGAYGHGDTRKLQPGCVYCYRFDLGSEQWEIETQFESPNPRESDRFGWSVSVGNTSGEPGVTHRLAVGKPSGELSGRFGPGSVFVYARNEGGSWSREQQIDLPRVRPPDEQEFGWSVDIERDGASLLLGGAPNEYLFGESSGAIYVARRSAQTGIWRVDQACFGETEDAIDSFGAPVALGSGASAGMAAGAATATQCPGGSQRDFLGAVYCFDLNPGNGGDCPAPVIRLQKGPDCANGQGGEIELRWFQATPDLRAPIALLYAKRTGNFVIPNGNPCSGTPLHLGQLGLEVVYVGSAGQFGAGRIKRGVFRNVCGGYLQLVDVARCATSNVVRIE